MIAIIPDYLEKAVTEILDEVDQLMQIEMDDKTREKNRHILYNFYDIHRDLPDPKKIVSDYWKKKQKDVLLKKTETGGKN